jgi:hypothetical protein
LLFELGEALRQFECLNHLGDVPTRALKDAASLGVMSPEAVASVMAAAAATRSAADLMLGMERLTVRSRRGGQILSIASRIAVGSPARAISIALWTSSWAGVEQGLR